MAKYLGAVVRGALTCITVFFRFFDALVALVPLFFIPTTL